MYIDQNHNFIEEKKPHFVDVFLSKIIPFIVWLYIQIFLILVAGYVSDHRMSLNNFNAKCTWFHLIPWFMHYFLSFIIKLVWCLSRLSILKNRLKTFNFWCILPMTKNGSTHSFLMFQYAHSQWTSSSVSIWSFNLKTNVWNIATRKWRTISLMRMCILPPLWTPLLWKA